MRKSRVLIACLLCAMTVFGLGIVGCSKKTADGPTKYTVAYERGAADATGEIPAAANRAEGESFTLLPSTTFARENYTFKCWSYDGNEYDAGAQFTMPSGNVTFTAVWTAAGEEDKDKYTVTYERGAADATGEIPTAASRAEGESFTLLPSTTFARENYTFKCWSFGGNEYNGGAQFTMPASNVTFTAVWTPVSEDPDVPTLGELDNDFYDATKWQYMTNNGGAALDGGDIPYSLNDGSIKFHRANQAIELEDMSDKTVSFMLKATNDFAVWFNSNSKDNRDNYSYRLVYASGKLRLVLSSSPDKAAAFIDGAEYEKGEWNRVDVAFSTTGNVTQIKVYINGKRAALTAGDYTAAAINVSDNVLSHTRPSMFKTGKYMVVKVWEAHNYIQLKPVAKADEADIPVIACIGASITEGAGASNFYTESYPAQLQNALGGAYNVLNFGKSGRTVRTDLGVEGNGTPIAWLENYQFEGVKAIKPDYAIFNIGTNDSKSSNVPLSTYDTFKAAFDHLLDEVLAVNPDMEVFVCTVPYAYSSIYDISNDNIRDIIAPVQRDVAEERGYPLIDLYNYVQNKSLLFGDGVHPNTTGYAMFVEIIKKAFEEGEAGLTPEFLDYIDEKYNDPEYELTGVHGSIAVNGERIELTVSGNIDMEDVSDMRLAVETGTEGDGREVAIVPQANGDFTATMDLSTLTGTSWYNVRVYLTETFYYFMRLTDTDLEAGDNFHNSTKQVTVRSWLNGGEKTFSFSVSAYTKFTLSSSVIDDNMLTVSGTSDDDGIRLYIGADPADPSKYNEYKTIAVGPDGAFTASFDLAELPVGGWYNARIYFSDGSYRVIGLNETTDGTQTLTTNSYFICDTTRVAVKSWSDGGVGTLSFEVTPYGGELVPELTVTDAKIVAADGKITLTVSGTTNDSGLRLYVGNDEKNADYYHAVTYNDGAFTASIDLTTLTVGTGWYNVRLYYYEDYYTDHTEYYTLIYTDVKNGSGAALKLDDVFYGTDKKVTIKTWASYNPLSLFVENHDSSYAVTADEIKFEDGYFVLTGTVRNVNSLYVYLINTNVEGSKDNYVAAQISNGAYTAKLPLSVLVDFDKKTTPFNLRYKVNDLTTETVNVAPADLDMAQIYWSDYRVFYLGANGGCAAVYYTDEFAYKLTEAEIRSVDGKTSLVLAGMLKDGEAPASELFLVLDETADGTAKEKIVSRNLETENGKFRFVVDVSAIEGSTEALTANNATSRHYYVRMYRGVDLTESNYSSSGTKLFDVNSRWMSDRLFKEITVVGDGSSYCFIRNSNSAYNTLGIVRVGKNAAIKLGDIADVALNYYAADSVTIDLSDYVDDNGTAVTYTVDASSIVKAAIDNGVLTVAANALVGNATVTVDVLSDGAHAFYLEFGVTLSDGRIEKTNTFASFNDADSWKQIANDGGNKTWYDGNTDSAILQYGNVYQELGELSHISFELWVNPGGQYGFELWVRSTTNDNNVAGEKYVINGYDPNITISRSGTALASFPRFGAGVFTRLDITMLDVYENGEIVKTLVNVYQDGVKVSLTGSSVVGGTIVDDSPIAPEDGVYFAWKAWEPQTAIRPAQVIEPIDPNIVRVAAVGDSTTYGHAWHNESYPVYLASELGGGHKVGNFGLNGASVTGFGGSGSKYSEKAEYNSSVAFAPDVIVIMLGANDANGWAQAAAVYEQELRALIASYQAACPDAKIAVVTSAPTLNANAYGIPNDIIENNINPIQRAVAQELGLTLIDLHDAMVNAAGGYNGFFREGDGVHFSVSGAQFAAKVIADAIKAL